MSVFARRLERTSTAERFDPWSFGIPTLDTVVKTVRPGFVNLIIARPHVGKTLLALAGIRNNPDVPTLFISADDDPDVVVRKMMFFDGLCSTVDEAWRFTRSQMAGYLEENYPNLDVVDDVTWGPSAYNGSRTVADSIDKFTDDFDGPPGLLVYDYLGIDGNDFSVAMQVASWQKHLVKELPMPVLTIAQSNRNFARTIKEGDDYVRRGFRMEDLAFGGEQQAGLMLGLSKWQYMVAGRVQDCIEVDVVKNKAVFDGSGLTDPKSPVVLCHSYGRLTDRETANSEWYYAQQAGQMEVQRGFAP